MLLLPKNLAQPTCSGSLWMRVMNQPLGVSSTLHLPGAGTSTQQACHGVNVSAVGSMTV